MNVPEGRHHRMLRFFACGVLTLLTSCCRSGPSGPMVSASPSSTTGSGDAATGADEELVASESTTAPAEITIRMTNRTGKPRYVGYPRHWTERLSIERREGDRWVAIAYEQPMCSEVCPADGRQPTCGFCSPPIPVLEAVVFKTREYAWNGKEFVDRTLAGAKCSCVQSVAARAGRYRATLCTLSKIECDPAPCAADEHGLIRRGVRMVDAPNCTSKEFDVRGVPSSVALDVTL
jgi:hypothetical protein